MKAIKCEMCGSSEIIKQDGVYVCQYCGTKYSPEEAKKLLIQGTVKIDQTETVKNYLSLAENAIKSKNYTDAEIFSNKAIEAKADEPKAWILKGKATAHLSTPENLRFEEAANCFERAIMFNNEPNYLVEVHDDLKGDLLTTVNSVMDAYMKEPSLNNSNEVVHVAKMVVSFYSEFCNKCSLDKKEFSEILAAQLIQNTIKIYETHIFKEYTKDRHPTDSQFYAFLDGAEGASNILEYATTIEEKADINKSAYDTLIKLWRKVITAESYIGDRLNLTFDTEQQNKFKRKIIGIHERWNALDPSHEIPNRSKSKGESKDETKGESKGGCYIATAVYGSYDCPEVWVLRRFRDYFLLKTLFGKFFVNTYYFISPTLVKWFGKTTWFRQIFLLPLNTLVNCLRNRGISDKPYEE